MSTFRANQKENKNSWSKGRAVREAKLGTANCVSQAPFLLEDHVTGSGQKTKKGPVI